MGIKINVSPGFILIWTAVYFFDPGDMFLPVCVSAAVHELCHLLAISLVGCRVEAVNLRVIGLEIVCKDRFLSYPRELICAAAGPAGSLIFSICAAEFGDYVLAGMNISLFLFNILPLKPLDGGRMIYAVTAWIWDSDRAEKAVKVCSVIVIVALSISAIVFRKWVFVYFTLVACKISGNGVKFQVKRRNDLRNRG